MGVVGLISRTILLFKRCIILTNLSFRSIAWFRLHCIKLMISKEDYAMQNRDGRSLYGPSRHVPISLHVEAD